MMAIRNVTVQGVMDYVRDNCTTGGGVDNFSELDGTMIVRLDNKRELWLKTNSFNDFMIEFNNDYYQFSHKID